MPDVQWAGALTRYLLMNDIEPAALLELIILSEAAVDYQVEFWLSVSFATVVASFAARHLLTRRMRWLISGLYLIATFVFVTRWQTSAFDALAYVDALKSHGIELPVGYLSGFGRMALFATGTLATIYFLHAEPGHKPAEPEA